MAAFIDENIQFVDQAGNPLVGGKVYIGPKGQDAKQTQVNIFSNRALTIVIANPQTLNAEGRSPIKIWIDGEYSLFVEDVNAIQHLREDDQGEGEAQGIQSIDQNSVAGANDITANAIPPVTSYVNNTLYPFQIVAINTGDMTFTLDSAPQTPIRFNIDQEVPPGTFQIGYPLVLQFREGTPNYFEVTNRPTKVIHSTQASIIASAASIDIWNVQGNVVPITGTTLITSLGTAPQGGDSRKIRADGAFFIENNANIITDAGATIGVQPGQLLEVIADSPSIVRVFQLERVWKRFPFTDIGSATTFEFFDTIQDVQEIEFAWKNIGIASGNQAVGFQLGTFLSYKTSGYTGNSNILGTTIQSILSNSSNITFVGTLLGVAAGSTGSGRFIHIANNLWTFISTGIFGSTLTTTASESVLLGAPLTRIRIQTTPANLTGDISWKYR